MTEKKTDRVTAKFGGRELTFAIPRELLPFFELMIKEAAQVRLSKIIHGFATTAEIREVLEYAAPKGLGREIPVDHGAAEMVRMRFQLEALRPPKKTFVSETMAKNGPMKYAVLAQGILAAALHGLPESAAHFDEDEEADDNAA